MVKVERSPDAPASLAVEKEKGTRNYRGEDVIVKLNEDFRGKCYLCEINDLQSVEVDHLKAHHNGRDRDRLFDWNNLFLCCAHCNGVKNMKQYEDLVLDCCQVEPEIYLNQKLVDGHVRVEPLIHTHEAEITAQLLVECFEKDNTGIRTIECATRVRALQSAMTVLYKSLEKYKENPKATSTLRALRGMLDRGYKFAGFTRTYVRQHIEEYPELAQDVAI